ncbi:16S rRNA processing protein RimM [Iocasia frigidifontis]|uniref:Ribosome maturation factor RimM n=1 Tax=Iocasia fonsfrigidae TaxID=2682810 RepID=A0A8A7KFI4_9FIRM|nr:ribosome maturation factor RimM [Iocasia fonsfrigidae]QTL98458.1 16S rRNA processing protein RimM [Iocasia fonsfrigidae]
MDTKELVKIGRITKNQGNKGEIRVIPLTDHPERFELLESVYLAKGNDIFQKNLEGLRYHKNFLVLKLEGIDNIGQALELRDYFIKIPSEEILPLEENEYYIDDLLGYQVITDSGEKLGEIFDVITTEGTDIFLVRDNNNEYMIPAAREIVIDIDMDKGVMVIKPISGLLEL